MEKLSIQSWVILGLSIVNFIALTVALCFLPSVVPTHINVKMEVDAVGSPFFGIIFAVLPVVLCACIMLAIKFGKSAKNNERVFGILMSVLGVLFMYIGWVMYAIMFTGAGIGETLSVSMCFLIVLPIGLAIIAIGNYLPKARQNSAFGVRLCWTKKNEVCWNKTNRFAGLITVISGAIIVLGAIICGALKIDGYVFIFLGVAVLLGIIAPIIYAKVCYDKIQSKAQEVQSQSESKE